MVDGVLDKAEMPTDPGLWFMDSSSAAAEMVTLCAASGFAVHFFPTGQGNVIGNPILPVIKICANPRTVRTMSEHVDVDVTGLLQREITLDQAGDKLLECMLRTANGRLTAAEALGHREFVLTRLYESRLNDGTHRHHRVHGRAPPWRGWPRRTTCCYDAKLVDDPDAAAGAGGDGRRADRAQPHPGARRAAGRAGALPGRRAAGRRAGQHRRARPARRAASR